MSRITGLGHFGIFVNDLAKMRAFYTGPLGFTVTDGGEPGMPGVFLSAQPEEEHHELAIGSFGGVPTDAVEVSFFVHSLDHLRTMKRRVEEAGCQVGPVVNQGVAIAVYFEDPEGNTVKLYWPTGRDYPQPFTASIDLDQPDADILAALDELPPVSAHRPHLYGDDTGKRLVAN